MEQPYCICKISGPEWTSYPPETNMLSILQYYVLWADRIKWLFMFYNIIGISVSKTVFSKL